MIKWQRKASILFSRRGAHYSFAEKLFVAAFFYLSISLSLSAPLCSLLSAPLCSLLPCLGQHEEGWQVQQLPSHRVLQAADGRQAQPRPLPAPRRHHWHGQGLGGGGLWHQVSVRVSHISSPQCQNIKRKPEQKTGKHSF